ncbi:hypothetical protein PYCC9005_002281 [Savitreella phatthalungensis]
MRRACPETDSLYAWSDAVARDLSGLEKAPPEEDGVVPLFSNPFRRSHWRQHAFYSVMGPVLVVAFLTAVVFVGVAAGNGGSAAMARADGHVVTQVANTNVSADLPPPPRYGLVQDVSERGGRSNAMAPEPSNTTTTTTTTTSTKTTAAEQLATPWWSNFFNFFGL